ncbi:MAG: LLM class F420-dependent oxidoreductase [SAR202 cluster bacterium]|jgi:probable F420-dependent oxidoreductase|nr:LLM class F420-dependent oxidoreductase [SAR202 cluster bacterium]|tara:strand:- start:245 stop:1201 length:957 start_codon:yes stop_codon:yes gene_type:complete
MEFGFGVPTRGPLSAPEIMAALAAKGEELGFGFVNVSDHVVIPRNIDSIYPYNESGEFAGGDSGECLDQLATIAFLAGNTSKIRLLSSVMVLPHRPPVLTAKMLATIDVLSNGRLILGCGVGWMREEFEALGAEPFDERGAVGSEYIRIFKELWTNDNPSFDGNYASFSDVTFAPKPVQTPHPPIWVGGESPPALRRAALLGDAWYPIGTNPAFPVGTLEQYSQYADRVRDYARRADRDPDELDFAYSASWFDDTGAQTGPEGNRRSFTGTPEQIAGDVKAHEEIGIKHLVFNFQSATQEEMTNRLEQFAEKVIPLAG